MKPTTLTYVLLVLLLGMVGLFVYELVNDGEPWLAGIFAALLVVMIGASAEKG